MLSFHFNKLMNHLREGDDKIAIAGEKSVLTYGQLARRTSAIFAALSGISEGPILIHGHKEPDIVAVMIAAALSGRGFVFAESSYPLGRVQQIIDTCGCSIVMSAAATVPGELSIPVASTWELQDRSFQLADMSSEEEDRVFYITFTSGSNGQPKGIPITRRNFSAFMDWFEPLVTWSAGGAHANASHASMAFDMSMSDIWPALFAGRCSYLLSHANNLNPSANLSHLTRIAGQSAGTMMATPAFLAIMLESPRFNSRTLPHLKSFWVGGEAVPKPLLRRLTTAFPECEIHHAYGPSEATCVTHCVRLTGADLLGDGPLPLGLGEGACTTLVDQGDGVLRTSGEGEIILVSEQVAGGYLPREHANNRNFGTYNGRQSYKTGDLGVVSDTGELTILGRLDNQFKLNGFRIELNEIEHCAMQVAGVKMAIVVPQHRPAKSLVLVLSGEGIGEATSKAVREHLESKLPPYMRPARILIDRDLPLSVAGKVDRRKLMERLEA